MGKSTKRLFKKIFWIVSIVFVLVVASGLALAYIYEAEVKQYAIEKINEQTKSKIKVEKIELSFLKRFPMAALQFQHVEIMEMIKAGEPSALLKAENIFLKFNVLDLIQNKLILKNVEIVNASLNLVVFNDGSDNFHIFKTPENKDQNLLLELVRVSLNNVEVRYQNYASKQELDLIVSSFALIGVFQEDAFDVNFSGSSIIRKYSSEGYRMFQNKNLDVDFDLAYHPSSKHFVINKGSIVFSHTPFTISGNVKKPNEGVFMDLHFTAPSVSLVKLLNTVPSSYKSRLADYKIQGSMSIDAHVKGLIVSRSVPNIMIGISLNNAKVEHVLSKIIIENINLHAAYNNGKKHSLSSSSVRIDDFSFRMKSSTFQGKLQLSNFVNSKLKMEIISEINLDELLQFTGKMYGIQKLSGLAELNLKVVGQLSGLVGDKAVDFNGLDYQANLKMKGSSFQHKSSGAFYQNIIGGISINSNSIHIEPTWVDVNGRRQQINGDIRNYQAWIIDPDHNKLQIRAEVKVSKLFYNDIEQIIANNEEGDGTLPNDIDMHMVFDADTFIWDNKAFHQATGTFRLKNQMLSFQDVKCNAFDGVVMGELTIQGNQTNYYPMFCKGNLVGLDINELFSDFNSFGQKVVTNRNIKGTMSSSFILNANFDKEWKIISKSIVLESDIIIRNGELNDLKELNALSSYTRIDDFSNIKFSTLENSIQIKDQKIMIPDMIVKTNKLDIDLAGIHSFENEYDYHISVLMSDVLFKKAKQKSKNEFGEVERDGYGRTKLFFHVYGIGNDLHVKYDRKSLAKKLKNDMKEDGDDLKSVLNKEFGWFKKSQETNNRDSLKMNKEQKMDPEKEAIKKQEEGKFIIEWDDEEEETLESPDDF